MKRSLAVLTFLLAGFPALAQIRPAVFAEDLDYDGTTCSAGADGRSYSITTGAKHGKRLYCPPNGGTWKDASLFTRAMSQISQTDGLCDYGGDGTPDFGMDTNADGTRDAMTTGCSVMLSGANAKTLRNDDGTVCIDVVDTIDVLGLSDNTPHKQQICLSSSDGIRIRPDPSFPLKLPSTFTYCFNDSCSQSETLAIEPRTSPAANIQIASGFHMVMGGMFDGANTSGAQTGIVTAASILPAGAITFPAGSLQPGGAAFRTFRVLARGILTTCSSCGNLTVQARFDDVPLTIATTGAQALECSQSNRQWSLELEFAIRSYGSGGTFFAQGEFEHYTTADVSTVAAPAKEWWAMKNTATGSINTTLSHQFDLEVTFSASGNTITLTNYGLYITG